MHNVGNAMKVNVTLVLGDVLLVEIWTIKSDSVHNNRMKKGIYIRPRYKGLGHLKEVDTLLLMPREGAKEAIRVIGEKQAKLPAIRTNLKLKLEFMLLPGIKHQQLLRLLQVRL